MKRNMLSSGKTKQSKESDFELEYDELEFELNISISALDDAVIKQAELYHRVSKIAVVAYDNKERFKDRLSELDSKISIEIKEELDSNHQKYTNQSLNALLFMDTRRKKLKDSYIFWRTEVGRWNALRDAYEQRSRMLGHLAKLFVSNYYAEPNTISGTETSPSVRHKTTRGLRK